MAALRRGREQRAFDDRVLESSDFVEQLLTDAGSSARLNPAQAWRCVPSLIPRVATLFDISEAELTRGAGAARWRRPGQPWGLWPFADLACRPGASAPPSG